MSISYGGPDLHRACQHQRPAIKQQIVLFSRATFQPYVVNSGTVVILPSLIYLDNLFTSRLAHQSSSDRFHQHLALRSSLLICYLHRLLDNLRPRGPHRPRRIHLSLLLNLRCASAALVLWDNVHHARDVETTADPGNFGCEEKGELLVGGMSRKSEYACKRREVWCKICVCCSSIANIR